MRSTRWPACSSRDDPAGGSARPIAASGEDLAEDLSGASAVLRQRVDVDSQRQRAAVGVAELRGDVGGRDAGGSQERRRRMPQRVHMYRSW